MPSNLTNKEILKLIPKASQIEKELASKAPQCARLVKRVGILKEQSRAVKLVTEIYNDVALEYDESAVEAFHVMGVGSDISRFAKVYMDRTGSWHCKVSTGGSPITMEYSLGWGNLSRENALLAAKKWVTGSSLAEIESELVAIPEKGE